MILDRLTAGALVLLLATGLASAHPGLHHDIERVTASIKEQPSDPELLVERAYYHRLAGDFDLALEDLDRAQKLDRGNRHVAVERGLTLAEMGENEKAEAELTRFLELGGESSPAYAGRARLFAEMGRFVAAIEDYDAAIRLTPDVELFVERGRLQEASGQLPDAAAGYRAGLDELGGAVTLLLALVRVETELGHHDVAVELIDQQLLRVPVKTDWYLRRAEVHAAAGNQDAAVADRQRALVEANRVLALRTTGIHLYSRAKVYAAMGRVPEAVDDLQIALRKSPRFRQASDLLDRLANSTPDKRTEP